jgi:LmbE family N-acetylglucosaminyl deacetylase
VTPPDPARCRFDASSTGGSDAYRAGRTQEELVTHTSVLAVFAHPDDAELGCFGTLAGLGTAGFDLHILALTDGANSCSVDSALRPAEAKESAGVIGANLVIEDFEDGALPATRETYSCIADHLARLRPAVVITHLVGAQDHQDHETAGRAATTMAGRTSCVKLILQVEPPLMNNLFCPNLYVDVTRYIDQKLTAIAKYRSEQDKPYVADRAIRDRATWWARQAETQDLPEARYYEAFRIIKAKLDIELLTRLSRAGAAAAGTGGRDGRLARSPAPWAGPTAGN